MRSGDVIREAGYDGEYGRIKLFQEDELKQTPTIGLFDIEQDSATTRQNQQAGPVEKIKPAVATQPIPPRTNKPGVGVHTDDKALDPDQQRALEITRESLLIIADPGAGQKRP